MNQNSPVKSAIYFNTPLVYPGQGCTAQQDALFDQYGGFKAIKSEETGC
jgi:hypothetical protein